MKRKTFILLASAGAAAVAIPLGYHYLTKPMFDPALANPESLSMIWEPDTIRAMGASYRVVAPEERSEAVLVNLLSAETPSNPAVASSLERKVKDDFKQGDTVMVDGWILSRTEARQCALLSVQ